MVLHGCIISQFQETTTAKEEVEGQLLAGV